MRAAGTVLGLDRDTNSMTTEDVCVCVCVFVCLCVWEDDVTFLYNVTNNRLRCAL